MTVFKKSLHACAIFAATIVTVPTQGHAGTQPFLGELQVFGGNFCPRGWLPANGGLLAISSNSALFSLFGTMYGGDGRTTMGLPDLRGRAAIGIGQGPGLQNYRQGAKVGSDTITLTAANLPAHNHTVQASNTLADKAGPGDKYLAASSDTTGQPPFIYTTSSPNRTMGPATITNTGGSQPINHTSPAQVMQWCVAVTGTYPSRN